MPDSLKEIAATAQAISADPVTDAVDVRRQQRRLAALVAQLADIVADHLTDHVASEADE